jgi:penicillin G amidase
MRRAALVAAACGAIVLLLVAAAVAWLHRSLPQIDGEASVRALASPVDILRDADGVPHLFAASENDGWFAMGYVHAQDRLWQMEFQRRVAQGRLAEFLGERAFETDRLMRTLGFARLADRVIERLDPATRASLEAYCAGINAFLAADTVLPVEFQVFRIRPEPWKPADVMGWLFVMGWDLSTNWRLELTRLRFAAKIGGERTNEIVPPYPGDQPSPLPDFKALYAEVSPTAGALLALSPQTEMPLGSNNWVLSGAHTESGKPLLANDPHLGLQAPALWYLAHVSTPQGNVVGGTLPGIPFVVLGHTDGVAWSMTTTNGDTQDLFVERLVPGDPDSYVTPSGTAKFEVHDEVIRVGSEERRVRVRSSRHGPVLSDAVKTMGQAAPPGYVLALQWAALTEDNATLRAGFAMNRARNGQELYAAGRDFDAPQHNVVYADREGHIGFVAPARFPIRNPDNEAMGRVPVPGWDAKYDWTGFIPYEEMPAVFDPPEGRIVTANHRITPPGYKYFISADWYAPYRANRINELLDAQPRHSIDSFARMQADDLSHLAREILPIARAATPRTDLGRKAQAMLQGWDGRMRMDAAAPLVFTAWYRELTRMVYADELDDLFNEAWDQRATFMMAVLRDENGEGRWCDDVRTQPVEDCAQLESRAFDVAALDLEKRFGAPAGWRWGTAHVAASDHRPFGFFPVISSLFNISPETAGDTHSVNVGHIHIRDELRPFANKHSGSLRAIYDLSDLDRSRFMQSTGQSGNVFSPWYSNLAQRWARVEYIEIPARREAIRVAHSLRLLPAR